MTVLSRLASFMRANDYLSPVAQGADQGWWAIREADGRFTLMLERGVGPRAYIAEASVIRNNRQRWTFTDTRDLAQAHRFSSMTLYGLFNDYVVSPVEVNEAGEPLKLHIVWRRG